ncbi:MAG: TIM barrel protein [Rhodobacteraceae bacterium]|nr:TIM barrel protein [Paracoccaceae bacterium]
MPRFAANLSMLFTDVPFLDRFALAASCGFKGVECTFPYEHPAEKVGDKAAMAGVPLVLFNAPPGDLAAGERGFAAVPGREGDFRRSLDAIYPYLEFTGCKQVHVLAGRVHEDEIPKAMDTYLKNLAYAADQFADEDVTILIEPINMEDYFLTLPCDAVAVLRELDLPSVRLQYDIFHAQSREGGITDFIEANLDLIAHIQVAQVPGRHEPDRLGELNWRYLFDLLDAHGYNGWIGAEYEPRTQTIPGLGWGKEWGIGQPASGPEKPRK